MSIYRPYFHLHKFTRYLNLYHTKSYSKSGLFQEELDNLLKVLENSNLEDLSKLNISSKICKNIIAKQNYNKEFTIRNNVYEYGLDDIKLIVLNKLICGTKFLPDELLNLINAQIDKTNQLSNIIEPDTSQFSSEDDNLKLARKVNRKKTDGITKRYFTSLKELPENVKTKTAVHYDFSNIAWTTMNDNREILDMSCISLDNERGQTLQKLDIIKFYEKVSTAAEKVPLSDLYVMEQASYKRDNSLIILPSTMKGMMMGLLDRRKDKTEKYPLVLLKDSIISKLYNLDVGGERISESSLGEEIISGKSNLEWLQPITFSDQAMCKYLLSYNDEQRQMFKALLVVIAFDKFVVRKGPEPPALT